MYGPLSYAKTKSFSGTLYKPLGAETLSTCFHHNSSEEPVFTEIKNINFPL